MKTIYYSSGKLYENLVKASPESRTKLAELCGSSTTTAENIQDTICRAAGHSIGNAMRGEGVSYIELLSDSCKALKIDGVPNLYTKNGGYDVEKLDSWGDKVNLSDKERYELLDATIETLESALLAKVAVEAYEKMSPDQRKNVDAEVKVLSERLGSPSTAGLASSAALFAVARAGGFGTYTLMSSVLSTLSMGTLSFGAYTFASSALSVLLGPAGLISMGLWGLIKLGGPDQSKVIQSAISCALVSLQIKNEKSLK